LHRDEEAFLRRKSTGLPDETHDPLSPRNSLYGLLLKKIAIDTAMTSEGMPEAGRLVPEDPPSDGPVTSGISIVEVSIDD
tara:strand:+ start:191 stop:430 length:240 start_codon:yes stop_codon:yes gene_type:complete